MRNSILQELHAEYEQRQLANQREEAKRRAKAEAACPEIGEVLSARQNLIFGTLRGILEGRAAAQDIPKRMDVLNRRLSSLLRQHGFDETYLDPVCRCPRCQDTGYVGEPIRERCECFNQAFYARMYQKMGLNDTDAAQSFATFDLGLFSAEKLPGKDYSQRELMNVIRKTCQTYAEQYPAVPVKDMLLMGQSGLGKTFLMHAMAKELIRRGVNVLMVSAYKLLDIARKAYLSGNSEAMEPLMDAEVLLIDDMGVEPLMENITIPQWFNLINERQLQGKGTIISTNLMEDELRRRYTERIASRLLSNQCTLLQFAGDDIRRVKV
ncbi:MAG: ATP-binding protein [Clostridiales bacterium]|nr:ATP-binding protein [Clostridiales bacterium]